MLKHFLRLCAVLTLGALFGCAPPPPPPVLAPPAPAVPLYTTSFICQEGNTAVQNAVCSNQHLAGLDVQLAAIYRQLLGSSSIFERDQVLASQRAWLLGLQDSCNVPTGGNTAVDPGTAACLAAAYQAQIASLTNWPATPVTADTQGTAIAKYVHYKPLDTRQPTLCAAIQAASTAALGDDGAIDPARLPGAQEIAGSHGPATGTTPQGGLVSVTLYRASLYAGYQTRARGASAGAGVFDGQSLGSYVESTTNGGGRFSSYASQTGDYGDIDVFTLNGQTLVLLTDSIGYTSPAPPGEAAAAGLYLVGQNAAPACLFETYIMPPPLALGLFNEQPSLTPFLALVDTLDSTPSPLLAGSDRQDNTYLTQETRWQLLNMPAVALAQARDGNWTGWLRARHDKVLDALYNWSQQSPANQAQFNQLFTLLRPAAVDLDTIYVQQQGLSPSDAAQATAVTMMELMYQATNGIAPGLGAGPANPEDFSKYKPRYSILANPAS